MTERVFFFHEGSLFHRQFWQSVDDMERMLAFLDGLPTTGIHAKGDAELKAQVEQALADYRAWENSL